MLVTYSKFARKFFLCQHIKMGLSTGSLSYELEVAYNIVVLKYTMETHSRMDHHQLPAETRRHIHAQTRVFSQTTAYPTPTHTPTPTPPPTPTPSMTLPQARAGFRVISQPLATQPSHVLRVMHLSLIWQQYRGIVNIKKCVFLTARTLCCTNICYKINLAKKANFLPYFTSMLFFAAVDLRSKNTRKVFFC